MKEMAKHINTLGRFLGMRDVPELTKDALRAACGFEQADVMVLFGGSILCGGDVMACAMRQGVAKTYVIVGGEGHTTQTLRDIVYQAYPSIDTDGRPEAEVFAAYLRTKYGLQPDLLECASTNCGNNITNLLDMLHQHGIACRSIILTQDASMQRRMDAGMRKYAPDVQIINYAAYQAQITEKDGSLAYEQPISGMWNTERYISLLMGEIPRLRDDENGYGPCGKGFIAHVDVPEDVLAAFGELSRQYAALVRDANPLYASK